IKLYENPPSWRLVRTVGTEDKVEEVVFTLQGVLVEKELPPFKEKPRQAVLTIPVARYKYLQQAVSITGFNMPAFARAISAAQEIYGKFDWQFTDSTMLSWAILSDVDQNQVKCLDMANHYFTPKRVAQGQPNVAFQKDVDPHSVLANMVVSDAVHSYIHMDNNQVQYFTTFKGVGSKRSCGPQMFCIGDIIQVQVSFITIPVWGNNYKMLVVLHSMALLDGSLSNVCTSLINVNNGGTLTFKG
ncbi:hypothetical protein L208DRAFT_1285997, partial [Tricholoma matsutake]